MLYVLTPTVQCAAVKTNNGDINEPVHTAFRHLFLRTTLIIKHTTNGYFSTSYISPLAMRPLFP